MFSGVGVSAHLLNWGTNMELAPKLRLPASVSTVATELLGILMASLAEQWIIIGVNACQVIWLLLICVSV
jgi:hypothetical protein